MDLPDIFLRGVDNATINRTGLVGSKTGSETGTVVICQTERLIEDFPFSRLVPDGGQIITRSTFGLGWQGRAIPIEWAFLI